MNHYIEYGKKERREAKVSLKELALVFDYKYYADKYPDLKKAMGYNETLLREHFLNHGIYEGRQAHPSFSVNAYKQRYSDLKRKFGSDNVKYMEHYMKYGAKEGRKGN
jgi:hypothetical protein